MTVIEFFERDSAVENIVSAMLCKPEKVVFIGSSSKRMRKSIEAYRGVLAGRNIDVEFDTKGVSRNNLNSILVALEEVISENDDCVIDLSGGDDLYLVAAGRVYERYPDKIKLHRFNISSGTLTDCDADGALCDSSPMEINIDENISVYGGRVIYDNEKANATYGWCLDDEFRKDVHAMWAVCKENASLWNAQINTLTKLCGIYLNKNALSFSVDIEKVKTEFSSRNSRFVFVPEIFKSLSSAGVIENLETSNEKLRLRFKNEQVMKCLTKAGQILELIIAVTASELKSEDRKAVYNDVKCGVYIDWDGVVRHDGADVENEMDVVLMKGMVPVFVSCKNGSVSSDELYKLSVVAERFGGKFARKVLVASELEEMGYRAEYIRARAADMGIKLIENVDEMTPGKLGMVVESFWRN